MTPNDIDVSLDFQLDTSQVVVVDDTDYTGFTVTGTTGSLLLVDQSQFIFQVNTPNLVNVNSSPAESIPYPLPVLPSGCPVAGTYLLTYNVEIQYEDSTDITNIDDNEPANIVLDGVFPYLEAGDEIVFSDMDVEELDGTYTIATVVVDEEAGTTTITLVGEFVGAGATGTASWDVLRTVTTTRSVEFTTCDKKKACLSLTFSCSNGTTVLADTSVIGTHTLVSRTLRLTYPPEANPAPVVNPVTTSNSVISLPTLYEGADYTGFLSLTLSYTLTGGGTATYVTTATVTKAAYCSLDLCCIEDCYSQLLAKYAGCNGKGNEAYENKLVIATGLISKFNIQLDCGDVDGAGKTRQDLKTLLGSDCSCGCNEEISRGWVTPTDSGFQVSQGFIRAIYFNANRITGSGVSANSFTNNPGFPSPNDFGVGDCIEIEIRALALDTLAEVQVENTTVGSTYFDVAFADTEDLHLKLRIVKTAANQVTVLWNYVVYDTAGDEVTVANGLSTYAWDVNQPNIISWIPDVPNDVSYYWISVQHITQP
jgi:hypothetical protein